MQINSSLNTQILLYEPCLDINIGAELSRPDQIQMSFGVIVLLPQ